jgi:uncharacterized membrane protein
MPGYQDGWDPFWMVLTMIVGWGAVIVLAIWAISAFFGGRDTEDPAIRMLRQRLAAGEISQEDFDKTKRVLQG